MNHEFDAIRRLFQQRVPFTHQTTTVHNGDDASVHDIPEGFEMVISTDTAVQAIHWPVDMPLNIAGARAVNAALSDLAAMGAMPAWIWLAISAKDKQSLAQMSDGIVQTCLAHNIELAGGDTTRSATNAINVTVGGLIPKGSAMTRTSAKRDDEIWLLGELGLSAAGLKQWQSGDINGKFVPHFQTIKPQLKQGIQLRELGVQCCLDVSDGLLQDTGHLCHGSNLSFEIEVTKLQTLQSYQQLPPLFGEEKSLEMMLNGGEDYALLFTAKPSLHSKLLNIGAHHIGQCVSGDSVHLKNKGQIIDYTMNGFDHFA